MELTSDMTESVKITCTTEEARKEILYAPARTRMYISACVELPIAGKEGKCFPGYGCIKVSREVAVKYVTDLLKNLEARGARIRINKMSKSYFIG